MGLFGGSDDDVLPYVRELVAAAEGSTVTADVLTDARLNEPVVAHLADEEQPHHVLIAENKPVEINERGSISTIASGDDRTTVTVLTDARILFVVGQQSGDAIRAVEYDDVYEFDVGAGLRRSCLEVTLRDERYRAYFSRFVDAAAVENFLDRSTVPTTASGSVADVDYDSPGETMIEGSFAPEEIKRALRSIDEFEFERFVADLWRAMGWAAAATQGSTDRGVDVVATRDEPFPRKHVIQAKRYAGDNLVGSPAIQQYASLGRQEDGVDAVVVVTTSGYTQQARQVAADLNVKLVDGDDLVGILRNGGYHGLLAAHGASLPDSPEGGWPSGAVRGGSPVDEGPTDSGPSASDSGEPSISAPGDLRPSGRDSSAEDRQKRNPEYTGDQVSQTSAVIDSTSDEVPARLSVDDRPVIRSTEDAPERYGSRRGHAVVAVLTAWWTLGIGNLAYASWAYHHATHFETDPEPDSPEQSLVVTPSANWYYGILTGLVFAALSGLLWWGGFGTVGPAGVLLGWLLLPIATYVDVQYVRAETDWNPITGWWLLGVILLPLAVVVVPLYVLKRSLVTGSLDVDDVIGSRNAE